MADGRMRTRLPTPTRGAEVTWDNFVPWRFCRPPWQPTTAQVDEILAMHATVTT